jgi:hypothetical protein
MINAEEMKLVYSFGRPDLAASCLTELRAIADAGGGIYGRCGVGWMDLGLGSGPGPGKSCLTELRTTTDAGGGIYGKSSGVK